MKQQKQKSRYQILEWHSQCTFHQMYLFDKDCHTKYRRKKGKRSWHENFAESVIKKQLGSKIAKNRTKKVTTYCSDCIDEPHLYLKCFKILCR